MKIAETQRGLAFPGIAAGIISVLLLSACSTMALGFEKQPLRTAGMDVMIGQSCEGQSPGSNYRMLVLQLFSGGAAKINDQDFINDDEVAVVMKRIMENRLERVVFITAGDDVPYSRVIAGMDKIDVAVPHMHLILIRNESDPSSSSFLSRNGLRGCGWVSTCYAANAL